MDKRSIGSKSLIVDIKPDTSVSFSRNSNAMNITPVEDDNNEDDIQISLAPYIQVYLAQSIHNVKFCGFSCPIPFERAAKTSWWDPRFDSEILEGQYKLSAFPQIRLRFRYSLLYIFVVSLCWCVYLSVKSVLEGGTDESLSVALIFGSFSIFTLIILLFTQSALYMKFHLPLSIMTAFVMFVLSLLSVGTKSVLTPVGDFSLCIEILMIIYTVIPLPLYVCVIFGFLYSVIFEYLIGYSFVMPVRILCHICVHLIGVHILVMTNVRMRGTFMKVGQSLLVRRQLEMEKQLKEKMILSVMPPKVAEWLMDEGVAGVKDEAHNLENSDIRTIFRPFNMHRMENVSILFADIVGFTRMSSNKTAEQLVAILNNLFERFDELCMTNGCEKISTLGDCYYCVSGCPEPRPDHARCCVLTGLGMIKAIGQFERESYEGVDMRVGVHTGTVLCGIVGTRRVKFDVWSNDVSLANKMESTGRPGTVHLSAATKKFLDNEFTFEEGEAYEGTNTYFVASHNNQEAGKPVSPLAPAQTRPGSMSLATAISIHNNQTAVLQEVLGSSQTIPIRTPSPSLDTEQCRTFSFTPPVDHSSLSPTTPSHPCPSQLHRALQMTSSLPSVLPMNDTIQSQPPATSRRNKWAYEKVPTACSPDDQDFDQDMLADLQNNGDNFQTITERDDQTSICQSLNSRKDSGIRSNSRKSSIQHLFFPLKGAAASDMHAHRVSGYYTSSQSSVNNEGILKGAKVLTTSDGDQYGVCFQKLRKQSDLQLIRCVQDNSVSQRSYFVQPPLHSFSLTFRQPDMEREYRLRAHRGGGNDQGHTLAAARFNTHLDIGVAILVFLLILLSCLSVLPVPSVILLCLLPLCFAQSLTLFFCIRSVFRPDLNTGLDRYSDWFSWHFIGGVLVSLPMIAIFLCVTEAFVSLESLYRFATLLFIGIIHFCNFTQLNCWMKSSIATVAGLTYLVLFTFNTRLVNRSFATSSNLNDIDDSVPSLKPLNLSTPFKIVHPNFAVNSSELPVSFNEKNTNLTDIFKSAFNNFSTESPAANHSWPFSINFMKSTHSPSFHPEIYLDVLLMLLLVWFLNREFEISYRLSFHGNAVAARDKARVQAMKDQAEVLLHNIIPPHVADHLKTTAKYSENVYNAGIIFASIINFSDMYDESYLGGRECLRVLNELISDFDELLSQPEFAAVEKIKTIGSTYMAASGLNPSAKTAGADHHLHALLLFALRLQTVVNAFNKDLLEFNLILRIGYCFGDITAGVIGTTKLHYDIWGDAVNIASRMDSTGMPGRVQLPAHCLSALADRFMFELRGSVYVKGKDNMLVYLVVGPK